ncbi:MAG TPA: hypothetical protein VGB42_05265 [Candidatus Thermoplasmatota archaeon]
MEPQPRCGLCVHWESRPELEMPVGTGYCDFHEKVYKASHSCEFFTPRDSAEGRAYKRQLYGGGEEDEEGEDDLEELEM